MNEIISEEKRLKKGIFSNKSSNNGSNEIIHITYILDIPRNKKNKHMKVRSLLVPKTKYTIANSSKVDLIKLSYHWLPLFFIIIEELIYNCHQNTFNISIYYFKSCLLVKIFEHFQILYYSNNLSSFYISYIYRILEVNSTKKNLLYLLTYTYLVSYWGY